MAPSGSSRTAAVLSAVMPGLEQFYNRQWGKGAGFSIATLTIDSSLGVTSETLKVFQSAFLGVPSHVALGDFILRMLPLAAIAIWSIADAARLTQGV